MIPNSPCPACTKELDACTVASGDHDSPAPGDYTVCVYCGCLAAFTETLSLREVPKEEEEALEVSNRKEIEIIRACLHRSGFRNERTA